MGRRTELLSSGSEVNTWTKQEQAIFRSYLQAGRCQWLLQLHCLVFHSRLSVLEPRAGTRWVAQGKGKHN